jgi:hypothetical protein
MYKSIFFKRLFGTISLLRFRGPELIIWKIYAIRFLGKDAGMNLEETKLCPNCARQGQIFPNISKRNQKLAEKVE